MIITPTLHSNNNNNNNTNNSYKYSNNSTNDNNGEQYDIVPIEIHPPIPIASLVTSREM
eukprot:UN08722